MELLKDCPECGKQLSRSRRYCACGWKIAVVNEKPSDRNCAYLTEHGPCKNLGSIAQHRTSNKWYCNAHWYEAMNSLNK